MINILLEKQNRIYRERVFRFRGALFRLHFFNTYNSLNLTSETLANGVITNYSYDGWNRINQIGNESLSYDQNSNISKKWPDTYVYDQSNQITQVKYTDKRYSTMEWNSYTYDLMWNRTDENNLRWITKTNKKTGTTTEIEKRKVWDYEINSLNQYSDILAISGTISTPTSTGATNTWITNTGTTNTWTTSTGITSTWVTDTGSTNTGTTNNTWTTDTWSLDDLQWRLLYDSNGNLIGNLLNNKREYEYTYDSQNRLIWVSRYNSINQKEVLIEMNYDPLGRRSTKQVQNQKIEYTYEWNNIIEETTNTVNPTTQAKTKKEMKEYIYGSKWTDDIVSVTITPYTRVNKVDVPWISNIYYYEKDHLWSIIRITTNTGWIIDEYSYTVFGKAYKKNTLGVYKPLTSIKSDIWNTRLYTGREYDREINLYYLRARYYDANLGRFISRDPIGMKDNVNLYGYVGNSSLNYTDRMGREKKFIAEHDATSLLIKDLMSGTQESIIQLVAKTAISKWYNVKYRTDYQDISFNPETKESCAWENYSAKCGVYIDEVMLTLSQIWNFEVWFNFNYAGFTLNNENGNFYNDIYSAWIFTEELKVIWKSVGKFNFWELPWISEDALNNEILDRPFYDAWYTFAEDLKNRKPEPLRSYFQ